LHHEILFLESCPSARFEQPATFSILDNPIAGGSVHGWLMFQNAKDVPQCNPQRKQGRALQKTVNFVFYEALALAYASGYMSQTEELASRGGAAGTWRNQHNLVQWGVLSREATA
jgi:hypothetical protein